jgi:hypothetical protein
MTNKRRTRTAAGLLASAALALCATGCLGPAAGADGNGELLTQLQEFAVDFARELLAAWLL